MTLCSKMSLHFCDISFFEIVENPRSEKQNMFILSFLQARAKRPFKGGGGDGHQGSTVI